MPFVTTNDQVKIHVEEYGSGAPLLLIHGWSSSGVFWRRNVEPLAEHFRVITMDLRGHGESEKPASGYRIARLARDMKDVIESLELENVAVAGWSMGSSIIWSYLELFGSEHLSKAVFVVQSPRQYYTNDWKWGQTSCYDAEALAFLTARLECDPRGMAKALLDGCLAEPVAEPEESGLIDEIMKSPGWVRAEIMSDHTNLDWRSFLPFISIPSLVIVGRKDKIFPWQGCAYVGDRIPGAQTVFFEESSHMPFYEEADKFNTVVRDFVGG